WHRLRAVRGGSGRQDSARRGRGDDHTIGPSGPWRPVVCRHGDHTMLGLGSWRLPMKGIAASVLMTGLIVGTGVIGGCQSFGGGPVVESGPYEGPRVAINSFAPQHQVRVTAPTGGWDVGVDEARPAGERRQVFITATRPAAEEMVTQALQAHEVNSTVDSRMPIDVYVRVVVRGSDPSDFPYRLAARSDD